jgi:hypothetical protein
MSASLGFTTLFRGLLQAFVVYPFLLCMAGFRNDGFFEIFMKSLKKNKALGILRIILTHVGEMIPTSKTMH